MPEFTSTEPFELSDFSGGKTDYYTGADPRKYQEGDNFLILKHGTVGKLFTRPGSQIYDDTYYQIPAGAQRINGIVEFSDELLVLSARKLYYIDGAYSTLQGPTGNDLFTTTATVNSNVSWYEWNKHLFITNSEFNRVQKVYKDSGGVVHVLY